MEQELLKYGLTGGWEIESPPWCLSALHGEDRYGGRVRVGLEEEELEELVEEEYATMGDLS